MLSARRVLSNADCQVTYMARKAARSASREIEKGKQTEFIVKSCLNLAYFKQFKYSLCEI